MTRQRNFARITVVVLTIVLLGILSQNLLVAQMDLPLRYIWDPSFTVNFMFRSDSHSNTISWRYNNPNDNNDNICSVEDIVYGEWLDDKPLGSMAEVAERYQLAVSRKHSGSL